MVIKYQLILLGEKYALEKCLLQLFFERLKERGIAKKHIIVLNASNFKKHYKANAPAYCLYFGAQNHGNIHLEIVQKLKHDANMILPVVSSAVNFRSATPEILHGINAFRLTNAGKLEQLVSAILEGFSLLRKSRRVFISYCRNESTGVAIQLYETLSKHGFDVFLDTHSIQYVEDFQEVLWHRMVDTDVVIALNTPNFMNTTWTAQEFAKANALSIGILQLIWPENTTQKAADLTTPIFLKANCFRKNSFKTQKATLKKKELEVIVEKVESLRARNLAARQDNIITEFIDAANKYSIKTDLQPEKIIQVEDCKGEQCIVIPTVGVPQSFNYSHSQDLIERIESDKINTAFILFDHRNIREKWIQHLDWLDGHLPIKTLKTTNVEKWIKKH